MTIDDELTPSQKEEIIRQAITVCKYTGHMRAQAGLFGYHAVAKLREIIEQHTGKEIEEYT